MSILAATLLLGMTLAPQSSTSLPWTYPGDFPQRLRMSGLVVSGTVQKTVGDGIRTVDGALVEGQVADVLIDRVFQGNFPGEKLRFTWFTLHWSATARDIADSGPRGIAYSGPPLTDFRPGKRDLIFLKRSRSGWEVAMPVYAIEVELVNTPPRGALWDVSQLPLQQQYQELAQELENAAMVLPAPPPGMTGMASLYFPSVFDLLGACAVPFFRHFLSSPSPELRADAASWLELIGSRNLKCGASSVQLPSGP